MYENVFWLGTPVLLGVLLGLLMPAPQSLPQPFDRISSVIGWVSCSCNSQRQRQAGHSRCTLLSRRKHRKPGPGAALGGCLLHNPPPPVLIMLAPSLRPPPLL